jgi:hypothetical protein
MQFVHLFNRDQRSELSPVVNAPMINWSPKLVFSPGYYNHNGLVYDLTQPGLYRLLTPMVNSTHMVIYDGDVVSLLSALSWLTVFGDSDNQGESELESDWLDRVMTQLRTSKARMLCQNTCTLIKKRVLDPLAIHSRMVHFLTMGTPNNVVDGHVALEVTINGQPTLVDIHNNNLFTGLAAKDVPAEILAGTATREWLSMDGHAVEVNSSYTFDATGYADAYLLTREDVSAWQARIFQAVGMQAANGEIWWMLPAGSEDRSAWVESLSTAYKVKDSVTWLAEFYP